MTYLTKKTAKIGAKDMKINATDIWLVSDRQLLNITEIHASRFMTVYHTTNNRVILPGWPGSPAQYVNTGGLDIDRLALQLK